MSSGSYFDWSPDGRLVALLDGSPAVRVFDIASGKTVWVNNAPSAGPLAWSPNGKEIATGHEGGTVLLWDGSTGEKIDTLTTSCPKPTYLDWSPASKMLAVANWPDENAAAIEIWDTESGKKVRSLDCPGGMYPTWSHDGTILAAEYGFAPFHEKLFNVASGNIVQTIEGPGDAGRVFFGTDGRTILCGGNEWNIADGRLIRALQSERLLRLLPPEDKMTRANSWSIDGRYVAMGFEGVSSTLKVWDTETGKVVFQLPDGMRGLTSWDFSPTGDFWPS